MTPSKISLPLEIGLLVVLALLWGSSYLFIKIALTDIPPVTLIAIRVGIASLFLFAIMSWRGEHFPRDGKVIGMLLIQSVFNSLGAWTVLAWGQQHVESGLASVLNSTSPVFVFLITALLTRHERIDRFRLAGACLGIAGVVLIVGPGALTGLGLHLGGQIAIITGAILYAGAAIYGKRFNTLPATVTAAATMIWASIFLVPASLVLDQPWAITPSIPAILATLALSVFCTAIALLIYFRLLRTLGSIGVASQSYLRAGIGVVLGSLLLGETISPPVLAGILCTLVGVAIINLPRTFWQASTSPSAKS
ncbi:DMT family transporter [Thalassospira lucentensis]|uniref:DMT family transporter n=1 Tax=Thalassospira lucentensis TaxID=168935 RepID=UPI002942EDF0|nr:EamA family transporter [Thalassospira lucentensis]WOI12404.1 EamA family transporter [Thalassospira lucentensis]